MVVRKSKTKICSYATAIWFVHRSKKRARKETVIFIVQFQKLAHFETFIRSLIINKISDGCFIEDNLP
jgi:hypothetical protein